MTMREKLTADRTYFLSPSGDDANCGHSAAVPKRTPLAIWKHICLDLDLNGRKVGIKMAAGNYEPLLSGLKPLGDDVEVATSLPAVTFFGDQTNKDAVSIMGAVFPVHIRRGWLTFQDMKLASSVGPAVTAFDQSFVVLNNVGFGACPAGAQMFAGHYGFLFVIGETRISGGAPNCVAVQTRGIIASHGSVMTFTNSPAFGLFADAQSGELHVGGMTFNNKASVTGIRYRATRGGYIETFGAGETYLPGTTNGISELSGVYA